MRSLFSRNTVQVPGAVVVCAVLPAAVLLCEDLPMGRPSSVQRPATASTSQTTPDSVAGFLREVARKPLSGAIYFRYTTHQIDDGPDAINVQNGVLYAGSHGELRLDLWVGAEYPIVCAVAGQTAWMVWRDTPLVYTSPLPIEGEASGWRGQLRAQVGQMFYWADVLLTRMVGRTPPRQVVRVENIGQALRVDLTARDGGFFPGPLSLQLMPAGQRWRIARIEAGDATIQYDGPRLLAGTRTVPSRITMIRHTSDSTRVNVWQIVDILPLEDVGGEDVFAVPRPTARSRLRLVGEVHFARDGSEHVAIWK